MSKNTVFTLAGKQYDVPPMNLRTLRIAWPVINQVMEQPPAVAIPTAEQLQNPEMLPNLDEMGFAGMMEYSFKRTRAALELLVIAMGGKPPAAGEVDALEGSLSYAEGQQVPQIAMDLLMNSGFLKPVDTSGSAEGNGLTS